MRIVRYQKQNETPKYGWLLEARIGEIEGDPFGAYRRLEAQTPIADVKLLAPCEPSKIVCVGRNYVEHAKELGRRGPKNPAAFFEATIFYHQPK